MYKLLRRLTRIPKIIPLFILELINGGAKNLTKRVKDRYTEKMRIEGLGKILLDHDFIPREQKKIALSAPQGKYGATCVGYFFWQLGLSESTKQFFNSLVDSGIICNILPFYMGGHDRCKPEDFLQYKKYLTSYNFYNNHIYFINADGIVDATTFVQKRNKFKSVKKFAIFWWEFNDYFNFPKALDAVDHVIVFSDFIKEAVQKAASNRVKVTKLLYAAYQRELVRDDEFISRYRSNYDFNQNDYIYFFNFDISSCFERKNPMSLLEAFNQASFKCSNIKLILKVSNAENFKDEYNQMLVYISRNNLENKVVIDVCLYSKNQLLNIMSIIDCYVSLHRSEGFGAGLLEAMQLAKPVIATNFGGNTDFMNKDNSCLVDYLPCEVQKDYGPYKKGFVWADPNIQQATDYMVRLANNPEEGRKLGLIGKSYIETKYSHENVQKEIKEFCLTEFI